jgi:hypothetical protein
VAAKLSSPNASLSSDGIPSIVSVRRGSPVICDFNPHQRLPCSDPCVSSGAEFSSASRISRPIEFVGVRDSCTATVPSVPFSPLDLIDKTTTWIHVNSIQPSQRSYLITIPTPLPSPCLVSYEAQLFPSLPRIQLLDLDSFLFHHHGKEPC